MKPTTIDTKDPFDNFNKLMSSTITKLIKLRSKL